MEPFTLGKPDAIRQLKESHHDGPIAVAHGHEGKFQRFHGAPAVSNKLVDNACAACIPYR
jgi:hypothetical protein